MIREEGTALANKKSPQIKEIGKRIQIRRKQLGLTQEQAAELSGLSQTYIANVERGARGLGDDSIIGLANALQTSTDYILLGKKVQPSDCEPIVQLLQQLDPEQLNDLLQIIRIYCKRCGCSIS